MSSCCPSTPYKERVGLVERLTFSPSASSAGSVSTPTFKGLADQEPGTLDEIASAIVGILHNAQAYKDDEVDKAKEKFVDWMKGNRIGNYSLLLVFPPAQFQSLAANGAGDTDAGPNLFTPVVLQSMEVILRAATILSRYHLYLLKDALLGQLKTALEMIQSPQHGGAGALGHHVNTIEPNAKHTKVSIPKFPDNHSEHKEWLRNVKLAYKESLQLKCLKDRAFCLKDKVISEQHCATLLLAFRDSVYRPEIEGYSTDNAYDFWTSANTTFHDAMDKDDEQMVAWMEIFGLSCNDVGDFLEYNKKFKDLVNILKSHNSVGLQDRNLMISAIQYLLKIDEFEKQMKDVIEDDKKTYEDLLKKLEKDYKSIVIHSEKTGDDPADSHKIRAARAHPKNGNKFAFRAPPLPPQLKALMPPKVWKTLVAWHAKINKVSNGPEDEELKNQFLDHPEKWVVKGGVS